MEIPKKLKDEIWEFCHANDIPNVEGFTLTMLKQGFNVEKYGTSPFNITQPPPEPEIIEKEIIKEIPVEVIKEVEVEKIVEKIVEVPVEKVVVKEVIKEVPVEKVVEKEVYITDDEAVNNLQKELDNINQQNKELREEVIQKGDEIDSLYNDTIKNLEEELDEVRGKLGEKPKTVVDDKHKTLWEKEKEEHEKTKKEVAKLEDAINHLSGGSSKDNNNDDIYGDKSRGWWGGGSNLFGKK